ncbi:MAG: hypothetical protein KAT65_00820 [Methanophagales archaeon]|nr:hypothetical protein [Methanophagales archaeon]
MNGKEDMDRLEQLETRIEKLENPTPESEVDKRYIILGQIVYEWLGKYKDKPIGEIAAMLYSKDD